MIVITLSKLSYHKLSYFKLRKYLNMSVVYITIMCFFFSVAENTRDLDLEGNLNTSYTSHKD